MERIAADGNLTVSINHSFFKAKLAGFSCVPKPSFFNASLCSAKFELVSN